MFDAHASSNTPDSNSSQLGNGPTERLRQQAKQRFIGAAVLVLLAVGALPFLLDSQPRPIASTITIDIPKIDVKQEPAALAPVIEAPQTPASAVAPLAEQAPAAVTTKTPLAFAPANDGQRAEALLNNTATKATAATTAAGKTTEAVPTTGSKYVVQAGSFSDPEKLQATAAKLDKAGIKHYTQAALGKDGTPRTRLRLKASFATKEEANAAAAQVAKLGIPVIVLKP
jgi:DedD protein